MEIQNYIDCLICIVIALVMMFRMMHYAHFYAPSYFFWIGAILLIVGLVSLIHPMDFLLITNRSIAGCVVLGGLLMSLTALLAPVTLKQSPVTGQQLDDLMPVYSSNEFHEVRINASVKKIKQVLQVTGVKDIPAAYLLMKIREIADEEVDLSDRASSNCIGPDTVSTPDFNFFAVAPDEWITVMILKPVMIFNTTNKPAPPEIATLEQFRSFNEPGYVKVAVNFRFITSNSNETIVSTETRNLGITRKDNRIFAYYWRMIYPGSAIIRRVWLDTIKKKAEQILENDL